MEKMNELHTRSMAETEAWRDIDAVWIYGNQAQSKLSEFSRTISKVMYQYNGEGIEHLLSITINQIEALSLSEKSFFKGKLVNKRKQYMELLKIIDDISVQLRVRQAQLLKSVNIFDRMDELIRDCQSELRIYIEVGQDVLSKKSIQKKETRYNSDIKTTDYDSWEFFFRKKLDELQATLMIASQGEAQIKLLKYNFSVLAEKIALSLSTTIPLWKNQVALVLGIEEYEKSLLVQRKLERETRNLLNENSNLIKGRLRSFVRKHNKDIDDGTIAVQSSRLKKILNELVMIEQKSKHETYEMQKIVQDFNNVLDSTHMFREE